MDLGLSGKTAVVAGGDSMISDEVLDAFALVTSPDELPAAYGSGISGGLSERPVRAATPLRAQSATGSAGPALAGRRPDGGVPPDGLTVEVGVVK
jgi:hypothetical protein